MTKHQDLKKEEQRKQVEHRHRIRHDWNNLIDDIVNEGHRNGLFDNLPGKGKPLNMMQGTNPYGADKKLAHQILEDNDAQPLWIMDRKEILAKIERLRTNIKKLWRLHQSDLKQAPSAKQRGRIVISWDDACKRWQTEITHINSLIFQFNLKRPINNMEIYKLSLEKELGRVDAPRWLK